MVDDPRPGDLPVVTVPMPAEMDMSNALSVGAELWLAVESGAATVIADMSETTFCDSSGLGALVQADRAAKARGTQLRVAAASERVRQVLALSKLDGVLSIYASLGAALSGQSGDGQA